MSCPAEGRSFPRAVQPPRQTSIENIVLQVLYNALPTTGLLAPSTLRLEKDGVGYHPSPINPGPHRLTSRSVRLDGDCRATGRCGHCSCRTRRRCWAHRYSCIFRLLICECRRVSSRSKPELANWETLKKVGSPYPGLLALLIRPVAFNPPSASSSSSNRLSKPLTGNNRHSMPCLPHCGANTGCSAWPPPGTGRGTGFGPCWFTQHPMVSIAPDKQRAASSRGRRCNVGETHASNLVFTSSLHGCLSPSPVDAMVAASRRRSGVQLVTGAASKSSVHAIVEEQG